MSWVDDYIVDPIKDAVDSIGNFIQDPLGALEDWTNAWLNVLTLGAYGYAKDQLKSWAAGLVPEQDYQDRQRTVRSPSNPQTVIYGESLVGGQLIYIEDAGKDNTILWMCYHIAGHEVEEIDEVRANGVVIATAGPSFNSEMVSVTNPITGNNHFCWRSTGDRGSIPLIPNFSIAYDDSSYNYNSSPPNWTVNHIGENQAFVWIALAFDKPTSGDVGLPKFTFKVRGKNDIYDPRNGTTGYTDNHALIVRDVLVWDRMFGADPSEIDEDSFIAAANISDELVPALDGTTEKRYTVNGTFKMAIAPVEIIESLSRAGAAFPVYSQGYWSIVPGAYQAPVMDLDESSLVGGLSFQPGPSKSSRHNVASGTYIDPEQDYQPVGFQELYVSEYVNQDLEVLTNNYDFPFSNSPTLARRLAKIDIERNRFGLSCSAIFKFQALQLTPGDRVNLYNTELGWSPKVFRVEHSEVSFSTGIKLELREDAPEIYDWTEGDALAIESPPALSIPSGITISSPDNLDFSEELYESADRVRKVRLLISWLNQPSADAYEVQYRVAGEVAYRDLASYWQDNRVTLDNVTDQGYEFRIQSISGGKRSDYYYESYQVDGFVSDLASEVVVEEIPFEPRDPDAVYSTIKVTTTPSTDPDYSNSIIYYRREGDPDWVVAGPADNNGVASFVVPSDGDEYRVRVFSESVHGIRSSDFEDSLITVSNSLDVLDPDVGRYLPAPKVNGLELSGQGNGELFSGKDAKFEWRKTSLIQWVEMGSEGYLGASSSNLDQYFQDYQVEIWALYDNGQGTSHRIVRTEWVVDPYYTYTLEKNVEDYLLRTSQVGAWREFEIKVYCRGRLNQLSSTPARLYVSNPPPNLLTGLSIVPGFGTISISYNLPNDLDFSGVDIWISDEPGFDPETLEPTISVSDNSYVAEGLLQDKTYYVRLRPFDGFGKLATNLTSEFSVKTKAGTDLTGLSGWAYQVDPADREFINDNLSGDSIPSTKLESVVIGKLVTGTLQSTETMTSEGLIRAVDDINSPQVQTGIGPLELSLDGSPFTALLWSFNQDGVTFAIDELGNPYFKGQIEASGYLNDKLEIDEEGNLTSTGTFRFGDISNNYVEFDGTDLEIMTPFLNFDSTSATLGNIPSGQYVRYSGGVFEIGPNANIGSNFDRSVTVGPGGDFSSINLALESLSRTVPAYKSGGFNATIIIDQSYVLNEQIIIDGLNLGWITLEIEKSGAFFAGPLQVSASFGLPIFVCRNSATSPLINLSVEVISGTASTVFLAEDNSYINFNDLRSSSLGPLTIECNSANYGIECDSSSKVFSPGVEIYDCTQSSWYVKSKGVVYSPDSKCDGGNRAFSLESGSEGYLPELEATNLSQEGFSVVDSQLFATGCDIELVSAPAFSVGAQILRSKADLNSCEIHGWGNSGISATQGSNVNASFSDCRKINGGASSSDDYVVVDGSIIVKNGGQGGQSQALNTTTSEGIIFG